MESAHNSTKEQQEKTKRAKERENFATGSLIIFKSFVFYVALSLFPTHTCLWHVAPWMPSYLNDKTLVIIYRKIGTTVYMCCCCCYRRHCRRCCCLLFSIYCLFVGFIDCGSFYYNKTVAFPMWKKIFWLHEKTVRTHSSQRFEISWY